MQIHKNKSLIQTSLSIHAKVGCRVYFKYVKLQLWMNVSWQIQTRCIRLPRNSTLEQDSVRVNTFWFRTRQFPTRTLSNASVKGRINVIESNIQNTVLVKLRYARIKYFTYNLLKRIMFFSKRIISLTRLKTILYQATFVLEVIQDSPS